MKQKAFSILELVAALAILAILLTALTPSLIRSINAAVARKEASDLLSCANALRSSIQRNRYIPGTNEWAFTVATELGLSFSSVNINVRNNSRRLIPDPTLNLGGQTLPCYQGQGFTATNALGSVVAPVNPRMILISSLAQSLPAFNAADFNFIWTNAPNRIPSGASWSGWVGNGDDLVIQRINLSDLFSHVVLYAYPPGPSYSYSIDSTNLTSATEQNFYVIKGTVLGLSDATSTGSQIINRDSTFVYSGGAWRNTISTLPAVDPGLVDVGAVQNFLASKWNGNGSQTQTNVVAAIQAFMQEYTSASSDGFKGFDKANFATAQQALMATLAGLIQNPSNSVCR